MIKTTIKTVALLAVLTTLAVGCQKETVFAFFTLLDKRNDR